VRFGQAGFAMPMKHFPECLLGPGAPVEAVSGDRRGDGHMSVKCAVL
jgi:hypothetical protein